MQYIGAGFSPRANIILVHHLVHEMHLLQAFLSE